MTNSRTPKFEINRRNFTAALSAVAAPSLWIPNAKAAAGQVLVRSPGGATEEFNRKFIWQPFEAETGIHVVPVAANSAKLNAMFKAGAPELDVIDEDTAELLTYTRMGVLAPIAYDQWKRTDPNDIPKQYKSDHYVGTILYGLVLAFNKTVMGAKAPQTWEQFWDIKSFPGPRSLPSMNTGNVPLEFALLAEGVPLDKLYPIDIERAFTALSRLRASVPKFWDSGAMSVQMLAEGEVAATAVWTTRLRPAMASGAPLGFSWTGHRTEIQALGVVKKALNPENAQRYVEYALRPEVRANLALASKASGPTNLKAYNFLPADFGPTVPGSREIAPQGFTFNDVWWADNREKVGRRWSDWLKG